MNRFSKARYLIKGDAEWTSDWIIVKLSAANLAMGVSYVKNGDVVGTKNEVLYWDPDAGVWAKKKSKALAK